MPVATFPIGPLATNSYIFNVDADAVAIDVGGDPDEMLTYIAANSLTLRAICLTHMHFDHLYGVAELAGATGAPVYAPAGDAPIAHTESATGGIWGMPPVPPFKSQPLPEDRLVLGALDCHILKTPGHTPGGVSFYFSQQKVVFTGDALFYRSMGRTDFPGGSQNELLCSIRNVLFRLPDDVAVYPGHGPATTIGAERSQNPFCGEFQM